ncbi:hypothetical protein Pcinc_023466 [Petrolisthes cinctipes]|uniref:MAM domain-containing protein n=1 Tax=Petrolisthes cinctipes TaxID=88211 RepID=A0AAE1KGT1_PETCI|nr:hypothetical protein Pcinc_023466 [Petrolisthes cinctipes]
MDTRLCSVVLVLIVTAAAWLPLASSQNGVEGCSFEVIDGVVSTCDLQMNGTRFGEASWRTSSAATAIYLGGPKTDSQATNDSSPGQGGYVVALVSDMKGTQRPLKAWLLTNVSSATQPKGRCLEFAYAVSELGVSSLQVLLLTYTSPDVQEALENTSLPLTYTTRSLWEVRSSTQGQWKRAHVTFSTLDTHSLVFSASSNTRFSTHRGYAAVDDITFKGGPCDDDCMFDVDLCTWANTELGDDFDWDVGRSSGKRGTGPSKDQVSYINRHINIITGGYAYIDSGYPRRPYDRAILESRVLPPFTIQHCLHFWVNMNGGGLGKLRVFSRTTDGNGTDILLWGMWESISGTDSWNECQQTVASNEEFQILFEASVRVPGAGDISLDTITLTEGSCPSLPSGLKSSWVDCTFLVDTCNWSLEPPNGASLSRVLRQQHLQPARTHTVSLAEGGVKY